MLLAVANSAGGQTPTLTTQLENLLIVIWAIAGAVTVLAWIGHKRHSRPVRSIQNMGRAFFAWLLRSLQNTGRAAFLRLREAAAGDPSSAAPAAAGAPPPSGARATGTRRQPPAKALSEAPLEPAGTAAVAMAARTAVRQASEPNTTAASAPPSVNPPEECSPDHQWSPETLEHAEARIGHPLIVVCPFTLTAHDKAHEDGNVRWAGQSRMWLALGEEQLWFLFGRPQPPPGDTLAAAHAHRAPKIGGVWDVLPRAGLVLHTREQSQVDQLEMSWPEEHRLIAGELRGPAEQRHRLTGLLASDQYGLGNV